MRTTRKKRVTHMYNEREIASLVKLIAEAVNPSRILLFGSYAYGTPNENSDVDLLVLIDEQVLTIEDRAKLAAKVYYRRKELGVRTKYDAIYVSEGDAAMTKYLT